MSDSYLKTLFPSTDWHTPENDGTRWWAWSRDVSPARLFVLGRLESGAAYFECILEHCLIVQQLENLYLDIGGRLCRPVEAPLPPEFGARRFLRCAFDAPELAGKDLIEIRFYISPRLRPKDIDPASTDGRFLGLAISNAWVRSRHLSQMPAESYLAPEKTAYLNLHAPCLEDASSADARNRAKLVSLRNAHAGGRCFIIGNGPSLQIADLERLRHEVTFAANKIYLAFDRTAWRPTYYSVTDLVTAQYHHEHISRLKLPKIFNRCVAPYFQQDKDIIWYDSDQRAFCDSEVIHSGFSDDLLRGTWPGFSVTFEQLQQACFMGFREIYLLGVDFDFTVAGCRLGHCAHGEVLAYAGEENYFTPHYRQVGEPWTRPRIAEMAAAYREARRCCDATGHLVRNATRCSRLDAFDRVDLDDLLALRPLPRPALISIVMPARDAGATIEEALASVVAQTHGQWEVLLIDDGCRDDTMDRARSIIGDKRLRILQHPDGASHGPCPSRALALQQARGDYIAFLDADDAFEPSKLEQQLAAMADHPGSILCHTDVAIIGSSDNPDRYERHFNGRQTGGQYFFHELPSFLESNHICNSSVMIRTEARQYYRVFNFKYQFEDWLYWIILSSHGFFLHIPEKLSRYRCHENSFSSKATDVELALAKLEMLAALESMEEHAFNRKLLEISSKNTMQILASLIAVE